MPAVRREIIFDPRLLQAPCSSKSRNDRRKRLYKKVPTNTIQFVRAQDLLFDGVRRSLTCWQVCCWLGDRVLQEGW
jgi:hypothetical protein